jgi:hypothetical protein
LSLRGYRTFIRPLERPIRAGALLLKGADERLGLTTSLAACVRDARQPGKVTHAPLELFQQCVFGIALGYPDANDARSLADDPIHKLLLGRDPIGGEALSSQPSLSRFENGVRRCEPHHGRG